MQKLPKTQKTQSAKKIKKSEKIVIKPKELHAKKNKNCPKTQSKTQSNPTTPIKDANTRKNDVFAPYLKKIVDYIIAFTGTKINMYRGLKDKALDWQEGGVKPVWAGLLFPALIRHNPGLGKDIKHGSSEIYGKNIIIFKQGYMNAVNNIDTECDVAGVIVDNNEGDKVIEGSFNDITNGNPGNWCGRHGKGKGDTDNSNLIHNYTSNFTLKGNNLVHLVHWSRNLEPWSMVSEPHELAVIIALNKLHVLAIAIAQNKLHDLVMRTSPTPMSTALSWSAVWSVGVAGGELVMAPDPDPHLQKSQTLQTLATSTWSDLRSSAASLTSRGSKSRNPPSRSGPRLKSGPKTTSQCCDLEQGKDLQNNMTLTIQGPKTHGPPESTIVPLTVGQVLPSRVLATEWGVGSMTKEANYRVMNHSTRNNVGLAGEWKYHLPKRAPKTTTDWYG